MEEEELDDFGMSGWGQFGGEDAVLQEQPAAKQQQRKQSSAAAKVSDQLLLACNTDSIPTVYQRAWWGRGGCTAVTHAQRSCMISLSSFSCSYLLLPAMAAPLSNLHALQAVGHLKVTACRAKQQSTRTVRTGLVLCLVSLLVPRPLSPYQCQQPSPHRAAAAADQVTVLWVGLFCDLRATTITIHVTACQSLWPFTALHVVCYVACRMRRKRQPSWHCSVTWATRTTGAWRHSPRQVLLQC